MKSPTAIEYFNRYTGRVELEAVYGEKFVRWTYHNPFGRLALEAVVKRAWFSRWYGRRMDAPSSRSKILPFIRDYNVDLEELVEPPSSYRSFNEFFTRRLKPSARPVAPEDRAVVFPADGRHLGFEDASQIAGVFVKGQRFDLPELLGDAELARRYEKGALVLSRLCPVDYHRFHFPAAGVPGKPRLINGPLYSVNPIALRQTLARLWQNKRVVTVLETEQLGDVLLMEIGATCVGGIEQTHRPHEPVMKGAEKGLFAFGGSSTITLFEPGRVKLSPDLTENSARCRELYARMGDRMGIIAGP